MSQARVAIVVYVAMCLVATPVLGGTVTSFVEDFTTRQHMDPVNTTAWWDTSGIGELKLSPLPVLAGACDTPGGARAIQIDGDYGYVADSGNGLVVIDVLDPTAPTIAGSCNTPGWAYDVFVTGDYAFVADGDSGLAIIDITSPTAPVLLSSCATPGIAHGVYVDGKYAYVADYEAGLSVVDISDPSTPITVVTIDTPVSTEKVVVSGNYAYVADHGSGIHVFDITNPASPSHAGNYNPGLSLDIAIAGDYAYIATYTNGLTVLDISDPTTPVYAGSYDTPDQAYGVWVSGNYAHVADYGSGLQVIDITVPSAPTLAFEIDTPDLAYAVHVSGDHAFVADRYSGVQVVEVWSGLAAPPHVGDVYGGMRQIYSIDVAGDYAYLGDRWNGLYVIDISDPANPTIVGANNTPGIPYDVRVDGDHAYVADGASGLRIIDISDPTAPTAIGVYDTPAYAVGVWVSGDHAYVADESSGLLIIDITDPTSPVLVGSYDTPTYAYDVQVAGDYAFLADYSDFRVIDVSDPTSPVEVGSSPAPATARRVHVSGDYAFVADSFANGGLWIFDISNPASVTTVSHYDTPGSSQNLDIVGNYAFVADNNSGLLVIDVSNPASPTLFASYDTDSSVTDVRVSGEHAFIVNYGVGLHVARVFCRYDQHHNIGQSLVIPDVSGQVYRIRLTTTQTDSISWDISNNSGATWQTCAPDGAWIRPTIPTSNLVWRSTHYATDANPAVTRLQIDWRHTFAVIDSIVDVPNDQGGWAYLYFTRSAFDFPDEISIPVAAYNIHRRIADAAFATQVASEGRTVNGERRIVTAGGNEILVPPRERDGQRLVEFEGNYYVVSEGTLAAPPGVWAVVSAVYAQQQDQYIALVPTTADSSATLEYTSYYVSAHTTTPSLFFDSPVDSGYSTDNIPPAAVQGFFVTYNTSGGNLLGWDESSDEDFSHYNVYRSSSGAASIEDATTPQSTGMELVQTTTETSWTDPIAEGWRYSYQLGVVDIHGNESIGDDPGQVTGAGKQSTPARFRLLGNVPNPFNPVTSIRYELARASLVNLRIYDVAGRLVRVLRKDSPEQPGPRETVWDGRDDSGVPVASGVYFYRIQAGTFVDAKRMVLLK